MKKLLIGLNIILIFACTPTYELPKTDIKIVTANILITNKDNFIEKNLLDLDSDIYLLHEAVLGVNIDDNLFIENGYTVYSHTSSSINAFNGILITRLEGEFQSINLYYTYGSFHWVDVSPFYSFNFRFEDTLISVIGAHVPPEVFMPVELKELRKKAIEDICKGIQNGKDSMGRDVIFAGDLNTHPTDKILDPILNAKLEDSFLYSQDRYDKSWKPDISPLNIARIDYIFVSENLNTRYLDSFEITGSDHMGLITGINIK